jgi:hypothetical protein
MTQKTGFLPHPGYALLATCCNKKTLHLSLLGSLRMHYVLSDLQYRDGSIVRMWKNVCGGVQPAG